MNTVLLSRLAVAALLAVSVAGTTSADEGDESYPPASHRPYITWFEHRGGGYVTFVGCEHPDDPDDDSLRGVVEPFFLSIDAAERDDAYLIMFFPPMRARIFEIPHRIEWGQWFEASVSGVVSTRLWFYPPRTPTRIRMTPGSDATIYASDIGRPFHGTIEFQNWWGIEGCNARGEVWFRDRDE